MDTSVRMCARGHWPAFCRSLLVLAALAAVMPGVRAESGAPTRHALLVGIGDYPGLPRDKQLQGPANDVRELRRVLEQNWGFGAESISSLVDSQATRAAILAELERLIDTARAGDVVLVYFSGHGTSGRDPANALVKQDLSDTGAFFPHDVDVSSEQRALDTLLIGRRDLRPRLDRLDLTGASTYVIADACFSGSLVRSALNGVPIRQAAVPGGIRMPPLRPAGQIPSREIVADDELESPYKNVLFLSAVGSGEPAIDVSKNFLSVYPTLSGKPQGAFTDALIRVLSGLVSADSNRDKQISFSELAQATEHQLRSVKIPYQPRTIPGSRSASYAIAQRSLFNTYALPQLRPAAVPPAPQSTLTSGTRVKLGTGVGSDLGAEIRAAGKSRLEIVDARSDLVVTISGGNAYVCDSVGDAVTVLRSFDSASAKDRAELISSVVARSIYRNILARARAQSTFAIKLDLADSNRTSVDECASSEQQLIARDAASPEVRARCAFDIGARVDTPARLIALNFDPGGSFYRIYPTANDAEARGTPVASGSSHRLISTFVETQSGTLGVEVVLALALPAQGNATDLTLFEERVPAERAESILVDLMKRSGQSFAAGELEIPVIPLGQGKRPGLGACIDDL